MAIARPEPDLDKLALALIEMATFKRGAHHD
jgi:hypothetical protein